jgi:hypothetical protein
MVDMSRWGKLEREGKVNISQPRKARRRRRTSVDSDFDPDHLHQVGEFDHDEVDADGQVLSVL